MIIKPVWIAYGVGAGLALLLLNSLSGGRLVSGAVSAVAGLVPDAFIGASEGLLGVPDTRTAASVDACAAAKAAGDCWAASIHCPAADYFSCLNGKYFNG